MLHEMFYAELLSLMLDNQSFQYTYIIIII